MKDFVIAQDDAGGWLLFVDPVRCLFAHRAEDVAGILAQASLAIEDGYSIAGFMAYEAAAGLDPVLLTRLSTGNVPLIWFGVYRAAVRLDEIPAGEQQAEYRLGEWVCDTSETEYGAAIGRIKDYIYAGDTYQVNYTVRLRTAFEGDPYALFRQLVRAQQARHAVYVEMEDIAVCSASPELFFEQSGRHIISRPMKGTAARGLTYSQDRVVANALQNSSKNRAENVMIVDMIRNDLGKIAVPGTVEAASLFEVEQYPTLHQMVSTVTAELRPGTDFRQAVTALFPCASITGAPKVRTMQIIRELEHSPRGVYTGMCGYWLADSRARFNVAIRTVVVDRRAGTAEYGTGGGIVWDSTSASEYQECFTKARILTRPPEDFKILETLLHEPESGWFLLDSHIARAAQSAAYFGYPFEAEAMRRTLDACVSQHLEKDGPLRVRWLLAGDGRMDTVATVLEHAAEDVWLVGVARNACRHDDVFVHHKTTCRRVYEAALERFPDCRDVILVNDQGFVTESCFANVVLELDGKKITPPLSCGLLNGTFRQFLLEQGCVREQFITSANLRQASRVWLVNSVRKWIPVRLAD